MKPIYVRDVVRSRYGRWGEHCFDQPAGIFSTIAPEGAAVSFLLPKGQENVRPVFLGALLQPSKCKGRRDWCGEVLHKRGLLKNEDLQGLQ